MEYRKMVLKNLFSGQQWRNRYREQTHGLRERGGMGEMYGERIVETYITICKIDSQWEFSVWLRELKPGLCNNLEGWYGEEDSGGRYTYGWLTLTFGRNQHNYVITLNLKINLKLKKERIKNNKKKIPSLRMSLREHHWLPLAFVRLSKIGLV